MISMLFPAQWRTDVVVRRGGRDNKGNPLPEVAHIVPNVLVGWRGTRNPLDRSDMTSDDAVIYANLGSYFEVGDKIDIPDGPWPSGNGWQIDGQPKRWQMGTEVPIRKGA